MTPKTVYGLLHFSSPKVGEWAKSGRPFHLLCEEDRQQTSLTGLIKDHLGGLEEGGVVFFQFTSTGLFTERGEEVFDHPEPHAYLPLGQYPNFENVYSALLPWMFGGWVQMKRDITLTQ